jgi:prepilin-type N-terminal cleavage/methylation domain-containing protein
MIFHRLGKADVSEKGFTLIELLVALAVTGVIAGIMGMAIFEVFDVNARSTARMTAVKNVENAVHWITRDAQMAQVVNTGLPSGFPLTLTWVEWNDTSNNVTYSVQNGELQRAYALNGGQPNTTVVAQHLNNDSQLTNCQFAGGVLTFRITTSLSGFRPTSESRSFKIFPRSTQ